MKRRLLFAIALLMTITLTLSAQSFGFDDLDDDEAETAASKASVSISGEAKASLIAYVKDFSDGFDYVKLGDIFSGKLNFSAGISAAEAFIGLNLTPTKSPVSIDEAYIRAWFGGLEAELGLRKLTWGKADSLGPLDIINPLDYSELTDLSNMMHFKIARPMVHLSYRFGSFSKLEGVFVPTFEPMRYAEEGRWVPAQMAQLDRQIADSEQQLRELNLMLAQYQQPEITVDVNKPDTKTLKYAQWGMRFTTTIGPADIGAQYYYGRLTRPVVNIAFIDITVPFMPVPISIPSINFLYNHYHQFGIDYAQVLFGLNVRAEFAVNITNDLKGDDGAVYNPHLAWSFGFDRDLVWGINLNIQANETIRLMNGKISDDPMLDTEADTDMTSTQIIAALSKSFFRDQLAFRAAVFYEIEARDFMFIPSLVWTKDALSLELSGGVFGGKRDGQFGQYRDNRFVKTMLKYTF
jgi:hypothetical protein